MSANTPQKLFFEDLAVGMAFSGSGPVKITREDILRFAGEFDPQPFHLDDQLARESYFKELVASGWHTACITMRMLVESDLQFEGGMIGTWGEISWPAPVRPGDDLEVRGEVIEILPPRKIADHGFVKIRSETTNQKSQIVQRMTARLMIRCRMPR